jgi:hypothetical protein
MENIGKHWKTLENHENQVFAEFAGWKMILSKKLVFHM